MGAFGESSLKIKTTGNKQLKNEVMNIKYPNNDCKFLEQNASKMNVGETEWYYFPYWMKKVSEGVFEAVPFENLPVDLKNEIKRNRSK